MKKKVNIFSSVPITALKYPFTGTVHNITLTSEEIRKCLFAKAKIEEILPNGTTVKLDFTNYNKINIVPDSDEIKVNIPRKPVYPPNTFGMENKKKDEKPKPKETAIPKKKEETKDNKK